MKNENESEVYKKFENMDINDKNIENVTYNFPYNKKKI